MTKEQLDQLLTAVDERISKAVEEVTKERDALKAEVETLKAKFEDEGDVTKALAEIKEQGDQTLREIVVGTFDDEDKLTKAGVIQRLEGIEKALATRKSVTGQDETVTPSVTPDPLFTAMKKAIENRGTPVSLGHGN